jgi:hypothetical protein
MRKLTMNILGHDTEVTEVEIEDKKEKMAEYRLEDGSVIRFIAYPTSIVRLDGQYTPEGLPLYLVLSSPITTVVSARDDLKRK